MNTVWIAVSIGDQNPSVLVFSTEKIAQQWISDKEYPHRADWFLIKQCTVDDESYFKFGA